MVNLAVRQDHPSVFRCFCHISFPYLPCKCAVLSRFEYGILFIRRAAKTPYNFKRICVCEKDVNWDLSPDRTVNDSDIASMPLKAGKYMKRFYMTDDVIEPAQKKIKCGNVDSGGWEVSLKGFFPGWGDAVMAWIATNGYACKGCAIFRN